MGTLRRSLKDKASSYEIEFVSPSRKAHWKFAAEHKNIEFEMALGSKGDGLTGFVYQASGGEVSRHRYHGVGTVLQTLEEPVASAAGSFAKSDDDAGL